ncbi:hypothetical protein QTP70_030604 [Hemibagrus guttatus]|uniref:ribonuclease H n=1 Tax=Hemibagrus guttatus TaxID=175788 RepID=A0AAE0UJB1_9TELE|nr:hypothetical protein QTP70_030604 [Hemibagrus guttatus]
MAEASVSVDQFSVDQFSCPVCLDLLKDPVTTPCGHSFCKVCINGCWDQEDQKGVYSCPQCRDTFTPRPVLRRNNMLAEVVEKLKKTEVQAASPAHCYAGPGDVECDFCTGKKHKAVKSCLMCLASFCETHLKPHYEVPSWKKHKLVEASGNLQEKICSEHDKVLEIYCRTDQSFICYLCMTDEHKGHDTVSVKAYRTKKGVTCILSVLRVGLKEEQMKFQQRIQEKQKKVQELKQTVNTIKLSAQTAVDDSERIFTELISSMEKKRSEVTELIRAQEKTELSRAERLLEQLEQEIADLQRRVTDLEQLSHTHDHVHFLQALASGHLKKRLEEFCEEEFNKIPPHAAAVHIISPPEPQSREDFLKYFCYLTLDPNTTHRTLILSEKNRVERTGGFECGFGRNNQSWSLVCSSSSLSFYHNNIETDLRVPSPSRIGVYVDHSAGTLSFYSVSDTMKLLHRVHTTFTQPLYAGLVLLVVWFSICEIVRRHSHPRSRGHVSSNLIYPPLLSQSQTVVVGGLWNCQSANTTTPAALSSAYTFSRSPRESGRGGGTVSVNSPINLFIIVIYRPPGPLDPRKLHNIFSSQLNPPTPPSPSSLTAEDFATFYTEKIERICQTFTSLPTSPTSHSQHSATPSLMQLSTVASEVVLQFTRSCNPTTRPLDPISSAMLQTISPDLLPFITTVINGSLTSGHVPTAFKKARVIPILKKPALDPSDISNYRPNNLHDPNQSGFKAAHSTETALLAVTEKLHAVRSAKLSLVLILLDLSAAFDTVNHKTLLSTLRSLGICGTAWEWFASYLDGCSYQVGCELEEKERFWSELDEVMESIPTGDEEVMGKFGVKERNLEGQMLVDFAKRMDMAVVNTYFQKREEHRVTYKSGGRRTQKKRSKIEIEKKTKWWKLKKEECCEGFRQKLRQALGGQVVLPDDWETTAEVIRETGRKLLGVSSGRRKEDKETWWWNEEVQDSIQRKRLDKKKWDMDRTEENGQEYKELQRRVKREVSKAKQKAYDELYTRLDTREGEKDLYSIGMVRGSCTVFVDFEKAYDRVPREELWYCMRKSGVAETYVRVVQDMYERSRTVVRCAVGQTEEFKVEVELHQGSALSPFLFAIVMDQLSEEVRQESPWMMMFADDIVICSESREQVEENLERWRFALERRGMKVSRRVEGSMNLWKKRESRDVGEKGKRREREEAREARKMAEASISVDQFSVDQFSCPVCLDLLKDPVTTPCGHSFCKVCINGCWDQEDQKGVYSCPQCRDTFTPRPVLRRNNMLAEVVEKLKKTEVQAASPAHCYAGPGDVECDFCTGKKHKAVKSCLMCLASFCETHLKPHYEVPSWKKHKLVEASGNLQEKICSEHDKVLEIYCRTDQSFICYLCMTDEHKGHDTVSVKAYRTEKESELKEEQMKFQQRIQEKQKKVQELKQTVNTIKLSAQTAVEDSERIFTELISSMEKKRSEVTELIRAQEKTELSRAERLLEQLEQEIADLQRRLTELEQFSHTHDHVHFLQALAFGRQSSLLTRPDFDTSSITVPQHLSFDGVRNSLSDLKKRLEEFCEEEFNKIPPHAAAVLIISPPEPQSREDFLKYFCYLTLDPNTTHRTLILSEKNRVVRYSGREQQYSDHPERFDSCRQVLCKESVCGRCYWEVERSGGGVYISVSYKDISRKGQGNECVFGFNNQSWSLRCSSSSLSFYHNNIVTDLRVPSPSRIGVYVDHSAGTLSFYSVSDTMKLLHRVHTTFTQPLYAGFWLSWLSGPSVRLCDPE